MSASEWKPVRELGKAERTDRLEAGSSEKTFFHQENLLKAKSAFIEKRVRNEI